jgi:hypothetical protein
MKKSLILIVVFFAVLISENNTYSQERSDEIKSLNEQILLLKKAQSELSSKIKSGDSQLQEAVDSLQRKLLQIDLRISDLGGKLSADISRTDSNAVTRYSTLDESLTSSTRFWIIAVIILLLISLLIYYILRKRIHSDKDYLTNQLSKTRIDLEEEGIKLDSKLIEILNTQLKVLENNKTQDSSEKDHSLAVKIADEIVRIEKNLTNMDPEIKGYKQLEASVKRIKDNFDANGYELVEMLNRPFDPGMKVIANFRPDEKLKSGEQIITRIIKPQINYKGSMIQSAQIEVSQGD